MPSSWWRELYKQFTRRPVLSWPGMLIFTCRNINEAIQCLYTTGHVRGKFVGHELGMLVWLVQFSWNSKYVCKVLPGKLLLWSKYAEFDILVINSCTMEHVNWQNHVNYILAINAVLVLCDEPPSATIVFDVKCSISVLSFNLVLLKNFCWFYHIHFETCKIYHRKIKADNIAATKLLNYELYLWITNVFLVYWPTFQPCFA